TMLSVNEIPLKGAHNVENVLAAVCAAALLGADQQLVQAGVRAFRAVEHRLEYVTTVGGVEFYNDSKATNVDATIKAIEAFPGNLLVILGGQDKGSDYHPLRPLLARRARYALLIGAAADKIAGHLGEAVPLVRSGTLDAAVREAFRLSRAGDVVLLAPACASFDQFQNYEHRGRVFKELVAGLTARP
ncbi:MAG: UDP-N-acetylmuramoyl-L-alanine--D-glutamate ligase, partial [Acidobacteria bacterium]|nr:UDP-N-acetylmuramoyl-L-alanine--D-glutamate ligase [Acidobacteriota bacterium]